MQVWKISNLCYVFNLKIWFYPSTSLLIFLMNSIYSVVGKTEYIKILQWIRNFSKIYLAWVPRKCSAETKVFAKIYWPAWFVRNGARCLFVSILSIWAEIFVDICCQKGWGTSLKWECRSFSPATKQTWHASSNRCQWDRNEEKNSYKNYERAPSK